MKMMSIRKKFADRFFFARMDFGTSYRGDVFLYRVYLHAITRRNLKQPFFIKYAEIDFLNIPFCNENADRILK